MPAASSQDLHASALGRELLDRVVAFIRQVDGIVAPDVDSVRTAEFGVGPGREELALGVEHDQRMLATIEDVHPIARVGGDARNLNQVPTSGQLRPALDHFETEPSRPYFDSRILALVSNAHFSKAKGSKAQRPKVQESNKNSDKRILRAQVPS